MQENLAEQHNPEVSDMSGPRQRPPCHESLASTLSPEISQKSHVMPCVPIFASLRSHSQKVSVHYPLDRPPAAGCSRPGNISRWPSSEGYTYV